ncbi:MAG: hypothetical protein Q7T04_02870 [Dehalococcoidia bacterium]|nr:hypothetical protein [Dehalococcoidia bacterium]
MKKLLRNPRFWPVPLLIIGLSLLQYSERLGIAGTLDPSLQIGLHRHSLDRILFLVPVIYAGYSFRFRVGVTTCIVASLIMAPRSLFGPADTLDALLETGGIFLIGVLACFWFEAQFRAKEQQRRATTELEAVQEHLQTQIRLSRSNSKRLATLNSISGMLSRSLESDHLLRSAIDLVTEVMEVEVALIFIMDAQSSELRLAACEGVSEEFAQGAKNMGLADGFNRRYEQENRCWSTMLPMTPDCRQGC